MELACSRCGQKVNVDETVAGQSIRCPKCSAVTVVPPPMQSATMAQQKYSGMAIAGFVILVGLFYLLLTSGKINDINSVREAGKRSMCMKNLQNIGEAIATYQSHHNDEFPPSLQILITEDNQDPGIFKCPSDQHHREFSYFYLSPDANCDTNTLMACDFGDNHHEIREVLFALGMVRQMTHEQFNQALAQPQNSKFRDALLKTESQMGIVEH